MERAQDLIYWLGRFWRDGKLNRHQVFLDSPMAIQASEIYEQHHDLFNHDDPEFLKSVAHGWQDWLPVLRYTRHTEQSMMLNNIESGAVIIAGSGMCTGGRIMHHLKNRLWNPKNALIFVGYQVEGTMGRRILEGARFVRIYGEEIIAKAEVHTINDYSAHADQTDLIDWIRPVKGLKTLCLIHGEEAKMEIFARAIKEKLGLDAHIMKRGIPVAL